MAEAVYRLHGLEKACVQILMSRGVLRDDELKTIIANLQPDFSDAPAAHNGNVQEILKNINDSVLPYSLCVRTVVMDEPADDSAGSDSDETESEDEPNEEGAVGADNLTQDEGGGEREGSNTGTNTRKRKQAKPARRTKKVFYHGLANAEEDFVAKQFGAAHQYQPNEVLLFNHVRACACTCACTCTCICTAVSHLRPVLASYVLYVYVSCSSRTHLTPKLSPPHSAPLRPALSLHPAAAAQDRHCRPRQGQNGGDQHARGQPGEQGQGPTTHGRQGERNSGEAGGCGVAHQGQQQGLYSHRHPVILGAAASVGGSACGLRCSLRCRRSCRYS